MWLTFFKKNLQIGPLSLIILIKCCESFTKGLLGRERVREMWGKCLSIPIASDWMQKVQMDSITAGRVWVSPPLNLHSYNDQVPFIGPCYLPKFWGKKPTTKTNPQKPPITPCGHSRGLSISVIWKQRLRCILLFTCTCVSVSRKKSFYQLDQTSN